MGKNALTITSKGKTHTVAEWSKITGLGKSTIRARLYAGWSPERAVLEQARKYDGTGSLPIDPALRDYKETPRHIDCNGDAHRKFSHYGNVNIPRTWMADCGIFYDDPVLVRFCGDHIEVWPCER